MAHAEVGEGIAVQAVFLADRPIKKFLNDLDPRFGNAFEPQDLHTQIMYAEELIDAGLSREERYRLPEVASKISRGIGREGLRGAEVAIEPYMVYPFKKFYGLCIADESIEVLDAVRQISADTIYDELHVGLGNYLEGYHVSIARRNRSNGSKEPIEYTQKNFPERLKIVGFNVGVRALPLAGKQEQHYINRLRRCNPAQLYG